MGPWALGVPLVLVSALGLLLNAYVLIIVLGLSKQAQPQQTANTLLLIHLGAVETAVCLVLLIFATGNWPVAGTWCVLHGFLLAVLHPIALWTVTGLNCDRYYAIAAPLHYTALVSPRRVVLGLAISWIGVLLLCLTPFSGLVPPYRYVPGLGCCAPDFGNDAWGSAGSLYGAAYAFLGLGLPALLVTLCNLRVLGIARYHRHRIASAIYEVTLSAQVTITHQRNPFFVPAVTAPSAGGPPRFHSAATTVMQLVGSLYLLYFPYCGLILWESCGSGSTMGVSSGTNGVSLMGPTISGSMGSGGGSSSLGPIINAASVGASSLQQQSRLGLHHAKPQFACLASLLLACSPPINGLLYGLKSRTLRRSVQNYWRKKVTKSELEQEIQARTPSVAGSRRPSGSGPPGNSGTTNTSFFQFPPLQRRLSEALLALGSCRAPSLVGGTFHRARLQQAASCNTLRVPSAELGESGRLVRSSASAASLMAAHYRSDFGTGMMDGNGTNGCSSKRSPRILITRAYSEESQDGGSPLLRRPFATPVSAPPCEKRRWRHRSIESDNSSTGSCDAVASSIWTTGLQHQVNSCKPGARRFVRVKTLEEGSSTFSSVTSTTIVQESAKNKFRDDETSFHSTSCPEHNEGEEFSDSRIDLEGSECNVVAKNGIGFDNDGKGEQQEVAVTPSESSSSWSYADEESRNNSADSTDDGLIMHQIDDIMEEAHPKEEDDEYENEMDRSTRATISHHKSKRFRRKSRVNRETEIHHQEAEAASQLRPLLASTS
ncbi:hypothetical protein QAD02_016060 [Eretmocerus hayati]|uniref:Uncharacterized protein n=1 Tax=Eretmocerus hayati TaxID=131215 RepID=A0ACC2PA07_9HYME|nr:hypothetical protein QAD02_016060 [Eretmocerus hayati]